MELQRYVSLMSLFGDPSDPLFGALSDPLFGAPSEPPTPYNTRIESSATVHGMFRNQKIQQLEPG